MPDFTFTSPEGKSYTVSGPEGATHEQAFGILQKQIGAPPAAGPQGFVENAKDFAKSVPGGIVKGAKSALDFVTQEGTDYADKGGDPLKAPIESAVAIAGRVLPHPQGRAGKVGEAVGEGLGNPLSYIGPGGAALKIGGAVLGSAGSEIAGQAAEGTPYETPARVAGALAGGVGAGKLLGPAVERAAVPVYRELKDAATSDYQAARNSGLELHPQGVAQFAAKAEQDLTGPDHGFTGGQFGDAPKTLAVLDTLQKPPAGATVTASNIDAIRKNLGRLSRETNEGKPTPDAAAASVALGHLNNYAENIPANHILAGDPAEYLRATKQGNANYAAAQRVRTVDSKIARAQTNTEGGIATSLDNQIKSQVRTVLNSDKAKRGFSAEEIAALNGVNKGTVTSNILRQLGRGGSGVVPIGMHLAAAVPAAAVTGGASLGYQALLAAGLYGAKKTAEGMTKSQARRVAEMLAKRSPEFRSRASRVAPTDRSPNIAAIARALATGVH